ncbi:KAG5687993.1hypothetical protein BaRGS_020220 [Octopus vulgaris]|uniref:Uncharacterized protein n=1 Tax=Octopus vulgaris TaxID=6645 RepID=A0AA36FRN3_OCTVU|nr:KAG5687993.1hypothetical protein BaRGS_020220 [Octopus vulgaris]
MFPNTTYRKMRDCIHTGEKPYQCESKSFSKNSHLTKHKNQDGAIESTKASPQTTDHGNADAFSCLPTWDNVSDREESDEDMGMVCTIKVLSLQIKPMDSNILCRESGKDPVITTVMRYVCEGWPPKHNVTNDEVETFQMLSYALSIYQGCLIHGSRGVVP